MLKNVLKTKMPLKNVYEGIYASKKCDNHHHHHLISSSWAPSGGRLMIQIAGKQFHPLRLLTSLNFFPPSTLHYWVEHTSLQGDHTLLLGDRTLSTL